MDWNYERARREMATSRNSPPTTQSMPLTTLNTSSSPPQPPSSTPKNHNTTSTNQTPSNLNLAQKQQPKRRRKSREDMEIILNTPRKEFDRCMIPTSSSPTLPCNDSLERSIGTKTVVVRHGSGGAEDDSKAVGVDRGGQREVVHSRWERGLGEGSKDVVGTVPDDDGMRKLRKRRKKSVVVVTHG